MLGSFAHTALKPTLAAAALALLPLASFAQTRTNVNRLRHIEQRLAREAFASKMAALQLVQGSGMPASGNLQNGAYFEVVSVENGRPVYNITNNQNAADTISTDEIRSGGSLALTLSGSGITLLEWDGGTPRTTHQDLTGRVTVVDGGSMHWHATHVAGTLIGSGPFVETRGMAPSATLRAFDWNSDSSEMAAEAADDHQISNHSYGRIAGWTDNGGTWYWYGATGASQTEDYVFGYYDATARNWDEVCYNAPYFLPVKSAGNDRGEGPSSQPSGFYWNGSSWVANTVSRDLDGGATGYDTIPSYGVAKNILTIGAVDDIVGGWTEASDVVMSDFSGWGPADDGRIKPDLVANGVELISAYDSANDAYAISSGTSMSSPSAAGSLALLVQHYSDTHAGARMRSATIKALAIHTADEAGPNTGPDYMNGWGLMNMASAAQLISDDVAQTDHISEHVLSDSDTFEYSVYSEGSAPLKVTIAWTDPQASVPGAALDPATKLLINDLDIRVSNGSTYFPWVLDKNNPSNAATTGDNDVDNVEQILIAAPAAGTYTITVSHKNSLSSGAQAFSMIVSGHTEPAAAISDLVIDPTTIAGGQTATGTVSLEDPAPSGGVVVSLESDDTGVATVPATVTVLEGDTTADFTITAVYVATAGSATITAETGVTSDTADIQVNPYQPDLQSITLNPQSFGWWEGTTATITLDAPAPAGGIEITLLTSSTRGSVQPSVTIPVGETSATVPVFSNLNDPAQAWNFRVFAFHDGDRVEVSATVIPARFKMLGFRWPTVPMGHSVVMVIRTNWPAPPGGWTIDLESSNPTLVPVPATATIPQGRAHVVVSVPTGSQPGAENVTITATLHSDSIQNSVFVFP